MTRNPREILKELAEGAGVVAGGPAVAYSVTLLKQCIDEFSKDFQK